MRPHLGDARAMGLKPESVQLVLTSPPYWTLKEYGDTEGQLGSHNDRILFFFSSPGVYACGNGSR